MLRFLVRFLNQFQARVLAAVSAAFFLALAANAQQAQFFLGMDRNEYPGDQAMLDLKSQFAFTGYWLNNPPGTGSNSWIGKRAALEKMGYGFLLLFTGREYNSLKASGDPAAVGRKDAQTAVGVASSEGFPRNSIIFLDQEQGGRMLPEQRAYIHAWIDTVVRGGYRGGVYCSGIPYRESRTISVVTANDIRDNADGRNIHFFISNDQCGPSSGCVFPMPAPSPKLGGVDFAEAWQYAQSPRRPEITSACRGTYAADGNCYPPRVAPSSGLYVDVESAISPDPSHARTALKP